MKVSPIASPAQVADKSTPDHVRTAKAVAAFNRGQSSYDQPPHQQPETKVVGNQNAVSVEELGAIQAPEADSDVLTQVEDTPEVEKQETPASRQFAQLARQEKQLRQAQQALKAEKMSLEKQRLELEGQRSVPQKPDLSNYIDKARLTADPLSVLAEQGISYDSLVERLTNQVPTDPRVMSTISKLEAQIQELKTANETNQKSYQENQQQAYQAAVKQIRTDARHLVYTDPNFETIKATNSVDDVVELVTKTYEEDGVLMSVEDAAQQVEDYLVEESVKLANLKKIQQRLQSNRSSNAALQAKTQPPKQQSQMKTLTNATGSTRQMSVRERAIAAMEGRLK